jgi:MraZ protein
MELPTFEPQARQLSRLLMGYATNVKLDGHSRIPLSQSQRVYAGLDKRAVLIGQGNKFELWDEDQWNERCNLWLAEDHQETGLSETIANLRI